MEELSKKNNYNDLKYNIYSSGTQFSLVNERNPKINNSIKKGKATLEQGQNKQFMLKE